MGKMRYQDGIKSFISMKAVPQKNKNKYATLLIPVILFTVSGLFVKLGIFGSLFAGLLVPLCYYIIMSVSLNLTVGILGELSLGHAGFMCVGAYVGGVFSLLTQETITSAWVRFPLAILIGGVAAAIFGVIIGIPILRLQGDYLAIVTLAFGEIIRSIMQNIYITKDINGLHFSFATAIDSNTIDAATKVEIMKGPMALNGIPQDSNLVVAVIILVIAVVVILNLIDSRTGRAVMSIRDNRIAAESTGINITKYKLIVFAISAFFAGVAGVLYAHYSTVSPVKFDYNMSILILVFVVLGGIGSIRGSIIATIILYVLPELLRGFQSYRMLIYAVVLVAMMLLNNNDKFCIWKSNLREKIDNWKSNLFKKSKKEAK